MLGLRTGVGRSRACGLVATSTASASSPAAPITVFARSRAVPARSSLLSRWSRTRVTITLRAVLFGAFGGGPLGLDTEIWNHASDRDLIEVLILVL